MNLDPGYWRTDNLSDNVVLCRNFETNCLGGT